MFRILLSALLLLGMPLSAFAYPFAATPAQTFTTGNFPTDSVVADYNEDGIDDVVVISAVDRFITLYVGTNGTGLTESGTTSVPVGLGSVFGMTGGDFNNDDNDDLVTSLGSDSYFFLGDGAGNFATSTATGTSNAYKAADFNNDGYDDLFFYSCSRGCFYALGVNNQDDTFTFSLEASGASNFLDAKAGLLNDDAFIDLVFAAENETDTYVLLGDGDGTFGAETATNEIAGEMRSLALADITGDGELDLVAHDDNATLNVVPGNGDGTFGTAVTYTADYTISRVFAVDVTGDDVADVIALHNANDRVSIFTNNGSGTLSEAQVLTVGDAPESAAALDADDDGMIDLVVVNEDADSIMLFLGIEEPEDEEVEESDSGNTGRSRGGRVIRSGSGFRDLDRGGDQVTTMTRADIEAQIVIVLQQLIALLLEAVAERS